MKTKGIKKVLVTDGVGFIGSHLIDALVTHGASVSIFATPRLELCKKLNSGLIIQTSLLQKATSQTRPTLKK